MRAHSPDEYVALDELERLCALVLQLVALSPEFAPRPKETAPGVVSERPSAASGSEGPRADAGGRRARA